MQNGAMKISMDEIRRLSVSERIELIGAIWDSIEGTSELPAITAAQKSELERRLRLYYDDPSNT